MKHIVNFSGGFCSFWAAHRTVERYGKENTILLFADVLIEDSELYEFNQRASDVLEVPITRVCYGLTPWELFEKEGLIGNARFPICSVRLKREPLNEWMEANAKMGEDAVVLGFDWTEAHRVEAFQKAHPAWIVEAPMLEAPRWDKCRMTEEARKLGFTVPKLYGLGFPHNNCGGRCVRAGISHWVHLLRHMPERFAEWEESERKTMESFQARGITPLTMLKDRRGGKASALTLAELRKRVAAGEEFDRFDWGGCGCGGDAPDGQKTMKLA